MLISNVVTYLKEVQRGRNLKFEISQRAPKGTNHRDYSTIQYNRTSSRIHAQHDRALADRRKLVEVLVWVLLYLYSLYRTRVLEPTDNPKDCP